MYLDSKLKSAIEKFKDHFVVVEGKKDEDSLLALGFRKVYRVNYKFMSLRIRAEQIALEVGKKDKLCILTDFDKRGKKLYIELKSIFQELGVSLDNSLRKLLLNCGVSHVEGLSGFIRNLDN